MALFFEFEKIGDDYEFRIGADGLKTKTLNNERDALNFQKENLNALAQQADNLIRRWSRISAKAWLFSSIAPDLLVRFQETLVILQICREEHGDDQVKINGKSYDFRDTKDFVDSIIGDIELSGDSESLTKNLSL